MKSYLLLACISLLVVSTISFSILKTHPFNLKSSDSCENFDNQNSCQGNQTDNDESWSKRSFQTPPRSHPLWRQAYQDLNIIVGYPKVIYSQDRLSANIEVITRVNPDNKYLGMRLIYSFGNILQQISTFRVQSSFTEDLAIRVEGWVNNQKIARVDFQLIDFIWNNAKVSQPDSFKNGQKGAIVEMFGWPYADIQEECKMLGKAGYLGVKVFPPQQAIQDYIHPQNGQLNPWYWLYQPVSYKLDSRMGTRAQLRKMIQTCRRNNVRVYADAVVNHMAGNGNDNFPDHCIGSNYWGGKNSTAGSPYWSQGFAYKSWEITKERPGMESPAVPYGPHDFHCARSLNSWTDGFIMNYGWLVNLADLNTESDYVRQRIADYFTDLIAIGFSGFRIDAAKHISPANLAAIFAKLKANLGGSFPADFISYLEVIIGGQKELLMCQDNSYNYGKNLQNLLRNAGLSQDEVNMIKIWESDYPKEFPLCGWPISSERYVAGLDCHDDQFPGSSSRDMGDAGSVLVKEKNVDKHRNFEVQLFKRTDGNWQIKVLLSSYTFVESRGAYSFPDGHSDCTRCQTQNCRNNCKKSMPKIQAHDPNVCGYTCVKDGSWQEAAYTRVHRDLSIIKAMRQWMGLSTSISPEDVGLPSNCS